MKRTHIAVISLLLAVAMSLGTLAATRTVGLGAASRRATDAALAARARQLNAFDAKLRRELAASAKPAAASPTIVYHRPPPVVVVTHSHHGDDGELEHEGGDD
jgi:hypothetical protein